MEFFFENSWIFRCNDAEAARFHTACYCESVTRVWVESERGWWFHSTETWDRKNPLSSSKVTKWHTDVRSLITCQSVSWSLWTRTSHAGGFNSSSHHKRKKCQTIRECKMMQGCVPVYHVTHSLENTWSSLNTCVCVGSHHQYHLFQSSSINKT